MQIRNCRRGHVPPCLRYASFRLSTTLHDERLRQVHEGVGLVFRQLLHGMLIPRLNGSQIRREPMLLYLAQAFHHVLVKQLVRVMPTGMVVEQEIERGRQPS